ncbi:Synaptotagmin-14 [Trichoplax sp. H2]|nr:Synaptotagmin-14 [Trichoplax sp. H2]|eukprot:RDD44877.1 Synaptotagmin-14 [Trichoplax sp. H2]
MKIVPLPAIVALVIISILLVLLLIIYCTILHKKKCKKICCESCPCHKKSKPRSLLPGTDAEDGSDDSIDHNDEKSDLLLRDRQNNALESVQVQKNYGEDRNQRRYTNSANIAAATSRPITPSISNTSRQQYDRNYANGNNTRIAAGQQNGARTSETESRSTPYTRTGNTSNLQYDDRSLKSIPLTSTNDSDNYPNDSAPYHNDGNSSSVMPYHTIPNPSISSQISSTIPDVDEQDQNNSDYEESLSQLNTRSGQVQFKVTYDTTKSTVTINIERLSDLPANVSKGIVSVHGAFLGSKKKRFKTKRRNMRSAIFNEKFELAKISLEDMKDAVLRLRIYHTTDKISFSSEKVIGESFLPMSIVASYENAESIHQTTAIQPVKTGINGQLTSGFQRYLYANLAIIRIADGDYYHPCWLSHWPLNILPSHLDLPDSASISSNGSYELSSMLPHGRVPELLVSLTYKPKIAQFLVKVIKAENLFHPGMANLPDSYVKVTHKDHHGRLLDKNKTGLQKCRRDPEYNSTFAYDASHKHFVESTFHFSMVQVKGVGKSKDLLGGFSIGKQCSGENEREHWNETIRLPNQPMVRWHALIQRDETSMQY